MIPVIPFTFNAGGNILPASFVSLDPANSLQCLQSGVGSVPVGISGSWKHGASGTPYDDTYHATLNLMATVFGGGFVVPLTCGTAWTAGQFLEPDASGYGRPALGVGDSVGAYALSVANAGEARDVFVLLPNPGVTSKTVKVVTTNTTLTAQDSGKIIFVNAADLVITLPEGITGSGGAAGLDFRIVNLGTAISGGATGTVVAVPAGDKVHAPGVTALAGKGITNTHGTAADGDQVVVVSNGIDGYNAVTTGTWARQA